MKLRNKIVNYFVIPSFRKEGVRVVRSKFMMNPVDAKKLLVTQFKKAKKPDLPPGDILQVCFDVDSEIIYMPNASEFLPEKIQELLPYVQYRITQDFGNYAIRPPIASNPFESLRVRSLDSFVQAKTIISEYFKGSSYDIPIIEANLSRMPETVTNLPQKYTDTPALWGGYVGKDVAEVITFSEDDNILLQQKTPFVLINTSKSRAATEKEWVVLDAYNEHSKMIQQDFEEDSSKSEFMKKDSVLYAIKRLLYMGWTFEEVSGDLLRNVEDVVGLFRGISGLMLAHDGSNSFPYYITFKLGDKFPISLDNIWDRNTGKIDTDNQFLYFKIIDYDLSNSYVILETPTYIPASVCKKVFNPQGSVFIANYNPNFNTIDIKSGNKSAKGFKKQKDKILNLVASKLSFEDKEKLAFSDTLRAQGAWASNPYVFNIRKISDYGYATDFIKKMCIDNGVPFRDFDVITGPIEGLFGRGVQGGFMDQSIFKQNKIESPFQITEDIFITPPVIFVNSVKYPSYPEQTEVLIHEYRHYIYGIMNPDYKLEYTMPKLSDIGTWDTYFSDPNEICAHNAEIKFELQLGKSYDEIIRNKVGGIVTTDNYPIAVKFSKMVQKIISEVELEEN